MEMNSTFDIVNSQLIYTYDGVEIFIKTLQNCFDDRVYLCFTRRKPKAEADDRSGYPSTDYNFFFPLEVGRKFLEELPATIDFVKHQLTKEVKSASEGYFTKICERLLATDNNIEYYIGIKQSNQYGSYQIYLSHPNPNSPTDKVVDFSLTLRGANAAKYYLPHILIAAENFLNSRNPTEPKTIPLERATTDAV